jgi:hypothetical protein
MSTESLWPANVELLRSRRVAYTWRKQEHDLVFVCICGGKLVCHESEPYHHCFGDLRCPARTMTFSAVVAALVEKAGKP